MGAEEKREKDSQGVTRVRFDLWAVLAFLVLLAGLSFGYLFNAQITAAKDVQVQQKDYLFNHQLLAQRITVLEMNYGFISTGIADMKIAQKDMMSALVEHMKNTTIERNRIRAREY